MTYKNTRLWQKAAEQAEAKNVYPQWQRLAVAYDGFRAKAAQISGLISQELPGLTLHNEKHLEGVWKTADLIAGDDYPMTPLEVFVFGGAVLLHDLGHTVTAYEGGKAAIKQTPEWRDAVIWRLKLGDDEPDPSDETIENPGKEIEEAALFDTLRTLHADQAERLCGMSFQGPHGAIPLFDDAELRPHLGQIIGRIAASHHWDREKLHRRLGGKRGALGLLPDLGTFQPVKLACLLRCADACQIDQRRAPDIDYALHQPDGTSKRHWGAQNRLSLPHRDEKIENSIAFTSTFDFKEEDADAWWVAHQELQECDSMMRDQGLPVFAIKGVAGASDTAALSEKIRNSGWRPVDASIRVSDPRRMVELFGGEQYYGKGTLWVALRELLQNGIDAIEARRALEPGFEGRVLVEQEAGELDGKEGFWLHVSDDGIGMSERVLTRTLVDFGRSAKSSGELAEEFRGLKGKRVRTIGQFGIGFFSVLMLSDHVLVHSRPFDRGKDATRKLRFSWGGESRPLLMSPETDKFPPSTSTRISLFIETKTFESLLNCFEQDALMKNGSVVELLQMIAPLPNCQLDFKEASQTAVTIRSPAMYCQDQARNWLASVTPGASEHYIEKASHYLELIHDDEDTPIGWATLSFLDYNAFGLYADRGLCQQDNSGGRLGCDFAIGVYPSASSNPRRSEARQSRGKPVEAWLESQLNRLQPGDFSGSERNQLSENIYNLCRDPTVFATISIGMSASYEHRRLEWLDIDSFLSLSANEFVEQFSVDGIDDNKVRLHVENLLNKLENDFYFIIISSGYPLGALLYGHPMLYPAHPISR